MAAGTRPAVLAFRFGAAHRKFVRAYCPVRHGLEAVGPPSGVHHLARRGLDRQLLVQHLLQNGGSHIRCELTDRPRSLTFGWCSRQFPEWGRGHGGSPALPPWPQGYGWIMGGR
jgi:hypothetical protein